MHCGVRLAALAGLISLVAFGAYGQGAPIGQLTISATVTSSISLTFESTAGAPGAGKCSLSGSGTNTVGLDLGQASYTGGSTSPCATYTKNVPAVGWYQMASAFDVVVTQSNTSSTQYQLDVRLGSAPLGNTNWLLDTTTLTTTYQTLSSTIPNGRMMRTLYLQVRNTVAPGVLSRAIQFTATSR